MTNLYKLIRAIDRQLGAVPQWRELIEAARQELRQIEGQRQVNWKGEANQ